MYIKRVNAQQSSKKFGHDSSKITNDSTLRAFLVSLLKRISRVRVSMNKNIKFEKVYQTSTLRFDIFQVWATVASRVTILITIANPRLTFT